VCFFKKLFRALTFPPKATIGPLSKSTTRLRQHADHSLLGFATPESNGRLVCRGSAGWQSSR